MSARDLIVYGRGRSGMKQRRTVIANPDIAADIGSVGQGGKP